MLQGKLNQETYPRRKVVKFLLISSQRRFMDDKHNDGGHGMTETKGKFKDIERRSNKMQVHVNEIVLTWWKKLLQEQRRDIDTTGIKLEKKFINIYVSKCMIWLKTKEDEDRKNVDISSSARRNRELIVYCRHLNDRRSKISYQTSVHDWRSDLYKEITLCCIQRR